MTTVTAREVVTLDGPSGVGKTAVARDLAGVLGWRWASAGLLYRALAADGRVDAVPSLRFRAAPDGVDDPLVRIDDREYADTDVRGAEVAARASRLATDPAVRKRVHAALVAATTDGLVLEGRSMHRLAPRAALHVFLWADPAERAVRANAIGEHVDATRDARDQSRTHDPLRIQTGMTVWNSTRYPLPDTVAGIARRTQIALGRRKPVVALLGGQVPVGEAVELCPVGTGAAAAVADQLRSADVALRPPRNEPPAAGWLDAHLTVLLAGNDLVTVGPAGLGPTSVTANLTRHAGRAALAETGSVGFTCDMLHTAKPTGTVDEWWAAAAAGARWVLVPEARSALPRAQVLHLRRSADCDALLARVAARDDGVAIIVDHLGLPALPLLAETAGTHRGPVHVVRPDCADGL